MIQELGKALGSGGHFSPGFSKQLKLFLKIRLDYFRNSYHVRAGIKGQIEIDLRIEGCFDLIVLIETQA